MPVVIQDFELRTDAPVKDARARESGPSADETARPALTPSDLDRKERARRERAIRLFAH